MSYRIRFKLPGGHTLPWAHEIYATREDAQRAIDDHLHEPSLAYVFEEATPEARIRELEAQLAQLRDAYDAARQDLDVAKRNVARLEDALAASPGGPAKASEAPGEGGDSGEGAK